MPAVEQRAECMKTALDHARSRAELAQAKQKRLADRQRRLLQLKADDQVFLAAENVRLRSAQADRSKHWSVPCASQCVNDNAVSLELAPLLGAPHWTFNISRLNLYRDDHSCSRSTATTAATTDRGDGYQQRG